MNKMCFLFPKKIKQDQLHLTTLSIFFSKMYYQFFAKFYMQQLLPYL